ncbi:presenilin-like signal peptide peptidase [Perkinsela sp. CCAP 1560/4]|nr:presenilin-like signal peptide peptidase [Perkinsela sp. CCAP 1560/4]|eukprot:KNH04079.1 presenilin-like signal peptide peptidase [Perkinsela sp. CCAP 1560/4]
MLNNAKIVFINTVIITIAYAIMHRDALTWPAELASLFPYIAMKALAVSSIFFGAQQSELFRQTADKGSEDIEHITSDAAKKSPIFASCMLISLFWALKYLSVGKINYILAVYFACIGTFAVNTVLLTITACPPNVLTGTSALVVAWYHFMFPHWITNNILGFSFALATIKRTHLKETQTAVLFLSLLFLYDIYWVFGTGVMLDVALKIDGPIKLVVPRVMGSSQFQYAMLGLGDIVVPGIFIALMHRMDKFSEREGRQTRFFTVALCGYILGLLTTFAVMRVFHTAQPALLYLVPAIFSSTGTYAYTTKRFMEWWNFVEQEDEDEHDDDPDYDPATDKLDDSTDVEVSRWKSLLIGLNDLFNQSVTELFGSF